MKKGLIIGLAATAVAAAVSSLVSAGVSAGPLQGDSNARAADDNAAQMVPGSRSRPACAPPVSTRTASRCCAGATTCCARSMRNGTEMRVLADAQVGDILSILPARRQARIYQPPSYGGGARIIHVPLADDVVAERDDHADAAADDAGNAYEPPAPQPRRRSAACTRVRRCASAAKRRASSATSSPARRRRRRILTKR